MKPSLCEGDLPHAFCFGWSKWLLAGNKPTVMEISISLLGEFVSIILYNLIYI